MSEGKLGSMRERPLMPEVEADVRSAGVSRGLLSRS